MDSVETHVETIASLGATEKEQQEKAEILDWIQKSAVNYELMQRDYSAAAQEGTGQVFLTSETFRGWLDGTRSTIYCPGLPGVGKTVMVSTVKDHLDAKVVQSNHHSAVLFFNYKRHREDHGHRKLLFSILSQFMTRSDHVSELLKNMFTEREKKPPQVENVMSVLVDLIGSSRCSSLLLDALDEFHNDDGARSKFLNLIRRLQDAGDLKVMMTARPQLSDDPAIWSDATVQIEASDTDLHSYLDQKICNFPHLPEDYDLRQRIADRIVQASAGM